MKKVTVNKENKYEILIADNLLNSSGELIRAVTKAKTAAIITDDIVDELYSNRVVNSLKKSGFETVKFVFKNGEKSKNISTLSEILEFLATNHLTRTDVIIALGGGVVGDIAGFAAGCYLRGIDYVQIPTTLLSAVDSSVGGKTAIDLQSGKNLAGLFYSPKLVICDYKTLDTLPDSIFSDGMAEVIKYAVLFDSEFFDFLNTVNARENLEIIIEKCVLFKRDIVIEDEFEKGNRAVLNLGHTIGHAIEKCSDFNVSHGSAVAIGMAMISKSAFLNGNSDEDITNEIIEILKKYSLPFSTEFKKSELYDIMLNDKKCDGDDITLILPKKIGECKMVKIKKENLINYL
ncbi:MAG: 3-dehydroquinate synthase [Oscillospiraceae bacterium]